MTHEDQSTRFEELLQLLSEHGFDGMTEAIEILMNEAMKLERADALGAMPYQRTELRHELGPIGRAGSRGSSIRTQGARRDWLCQPRGPPLGHTTS